jgi:hypothetical protein
MVCQQKCLQLESTLEGGECSKSFARLAKRLFCQCAKKYTKLFTRYKAFLTVYSAARNDESECVQEGTLATVSVVAVELFFHDR